jgi:hypothetical protein
MAPVTARRGAGDLQCVSGPETLPAVILARMAGVPVGRLGVDGAGRAHGVECARGSGLVAVAPSVAQAGGGVAPCLGHLALLLPCGLVPLALTLLAVSALGQLLGGASALLLGQVAVAVDARQVVADAHGVAGLEAVGAGAGLVAPHGQVPAGRAVPVAMLVRMELGAAVGAEDRRSVVLQGGHAAVGYRLHVVSSSGVQT